MSAEDRIKFHESLARLIELEGSIETRKKIEQGLGIKQASISQYLKKKSRPRLDTLVELADFFQVSLDRLVFGELDSGDVSATVDYGPVARLLDVQMAEAIESAARNREFVRKIGVLLSERIEKAAETVANASSSVAGLLSDTDALTLERYSLETQVLAMDFRFELHDHGTEDGIGRFIPVIAENLVRGRSYRYIVPGSEHRWRRKVGRLKEAVIQHCGGDRLPLEMLKCKAADFPAIAGCYLYRLDLEGLMAEEAVFGEGIMNDIDEEGWFGCTVAPSAIPQADVIMDREHLARAKETFRALWESGQAI